MQETIYKDFYVPLPPLYIEFNRVFFAFPDPLLAERITMVAVFTFLTAGLFDLLKIYFSHRISFVVTFLSVVLFQSISTNTIAGYFEFSVALILWGSVLSHRGGRTAQFLGGFLIACGSLTKQNFVTFGFVLVLYFTWNWVKERKLYWPALGLIFAYSVFALKLILDGTLLAFIEIMMQGGGKNPNGNQLFQNLLYPFSNLEILYSSLVITLLFLILLSVLPVLSIAITNLASSLFSTFVIFEILGLKNLFANSSTTAKLLCFSVIFATNFLIGRIDLFQNISRRMLFILLSFTPAFTFICLEILFRTNSDLGLELVDKFSVLTSQTFLRIDNLLTLVGVAGVIGILTQQLPPSHKFRSHQFLIYLWSVSTSVLLNAFNGGFAYIVSFPLLAFGIAYLTDKLFSKFSHLRENGTGFLVFVILISSITFNTYSWFGWNEKHNIHVFQKDGGIDIFRNFYLSKTQNDYYVEIYRGIQTAEQQLPQSYSSEIVSWPSQPILMGLSNAKHYKTNCIILHFDVCPENEARKDLLRIVDEPPSIVVYTDLGIEFIQNEESIWRNGNISSQRQIRENFLNDDLYKVVSKIPSNNHVLATTYVLIRR
jgi:hypothetical protein